MKGIVENILVFCLTIITCTCVAPNKVLAQYIRSSILNHQLDALFFNPGVAGSAAYLYFDATYLTSFTGGSNLSRSALVSIHSPSGSEGLAGVGGTLQFFKSSQFGELSVRPVYSRMFPLRYGTLSAGAVVGLNYFDFDDDGFGVIPENFSSVESGFGIYYSSKKIFAGISAPNLFEVDLFAEKGSISVIPRERAVNFHSGTLFRLYDNIKARPMILLRYADLYFLPKDANNIQGSENMKSIDFMPSFVVDDTYLIGLLYGYSSYTHGNNLSRLGVSATVLFGQFHIGYAIQRNGGEQLGVELPMIHIVNAGYIFGKSDKTGAGRIY